ncbi:MAG: hypothetical protein ABGY41_16335, partial [Candidatus Poribacteria bacterium]
MMVTLSACLVVAAASAVPVVDVEDIVATYTPADNGAGPLWSYGAPLIARVGDTVYVSALETGEDVEPLCNTRWRLFARDDDGGWELLAHAPEFDTREPSPLGVTCDGRVFLSTNPLIDLAGRRSGPSGPQIVELQDLSDTAIMDDFSSKLSALGPDDQTMAEFVEDNRQFFRPIGRTKKHLKGLGFEMPIFNLTNFFVIGIGKGRLLYLDPPCSL